MVVWRLLVTGLVGWCGYNAALMLECPSVGLALPAEWVCYSTDAGPAPGVYAGGGLLAVALAVLVIAWLPPYRRLRTSAVRAMSLSANLHRLEGSASWGDDPENRRSDDRTPDTSGQSATAGLGEQGPDSGDAESEQPMEGSAPDADDPGGSEDRRRVDEISDEVQRVAAQLSSGSVSPRDVFWQWLGLLKEINSRHAEGSLATDRFIELNAELLDLIPEPGRSRPDQVNSVSG